MANNVSKRTIGIITPDEKKPFPFDKEKIAKIKKTENGYSILVHSGVNHFDDRACVALFRLIMAGEPITYTRAIIDPISNDSPAWEQEVPEGKVSVIADIGRRYEPENGYFDHHQELDTDHKNFAAFGLMWEYFTTPETREYYREFNEFVHTMDNHDTGVQPSPLCNFIKAYNKFSDPVYGEFDSEENLFNDSVSWLTMMFRRMLINSHVVRKAEAAVSVNSTVKTVKNSIGNELNILMMNHFYPAWNSYAVAKNCVLAAWKTDPDDTRNPDKYLVEVVRPNMNSYETPVRFPEEWADKKTAPEYVAFCHKSGFLCVVDTYEQAVDTLRHIVVNDHKDKRFNLSITVPEGTQLESIYDKFYSDFYGMGDYNEGVIKITQYPDPDSMGLHQDTREVTVDFNMNDSISANQGISMINRIFADIAEDLYDYHDEILEKPAGNIPGLF